MIPAVLVRGCSDMTELRWGGIAGILFAVVLVAGVLVSGDVPTDDDADDEYVEFYEDSGNQTALVCSAYLMVLAGLAFVAFAGLGLNGRPEVGPWHSADARTHGNGSIHHWCGGARRRRHRACVCCRRDGSAMHRWTLEWHASCPASPTGSCWSWAG